MKFFQAKSYSISSYYSNYIATDSATISRLTKVRRGKLIYLKKHLEKSINSFYGIK